MKFYFIVLAKLSLIFYFACGVASQNACEISSNKERFDCYPDPDATKEKCLQRGCCWQIDIDLKVPFCYFPKNFTNYQVVKEIINTTAEISYLISKTKATFRPKEILNLNVDIFYDSNNRLRVRVTDPVNKRFEVPLQINYDERLRSADTDYYVHVNQNPFAIKVYRKSNNKLM